MKILQIIFWIVSTIFVPIVTLILSKYIEKNGLDNTLAKIKYYSLAVFFYGSFILGWSYLLWIVIAEINEPISRKIIIDIVALIVLPIIFFFFLILAYIIDRLVGIFLSLKKDQK